MRRLLLDYLKATGLYLLVVGGGTVLVLTLSSAVGYLPYSDRPGPGWQGPSISLSQFRYYLSWATLLAIPLLIWGSAVFWLVRVLAWLGAPTLYLRPIAGLLAAAISLITVAAVGWYIAMAAFPVWVAALLGSAWGSVLLPRFLGDLSHEKPTPARWAAIGIVTVAVPGLIYWTFFVPGYSQQLRVQFIRVSPSETALELDRWQRSLEPSQIDVLEALFPKGAIHGGLSGSSSGGPDVAHMLVVFTGPLDSEVELRVPKAATVVYVQQGTEWTMYPSTAHTLRSSITLGPASHRDEVMFAWPNAKPKSFGWYPPIE